MNKGIRQEHRYKAHLKALGWLVTRSAGSHGAFDLVAIHKDLKQIKFIQLKYGSEKYLKYGNLDKNDYAWLNDKFDVSFELIKLVPHKRIINQDDS